MPVLFPTQSLTACLASIVCSTKLNTSIAYDHFCHISYFILLGATQCDFNFRPTSLQICSSLSWLYTHELLVFIIRTKGNKEALFSV